MTPSGRVIDERSDLASLVGDADHFRCAVFGRAPWRGHSPAATGLFDIDDVDRMLVSAIRTPAIRMIRDGDRIPAASFCTPTRIGATTVDDVADPRKVLDQYRRGATLVLQSLHRTWSPLSIWCAGLERELGWPVQVNAYLTPPRQRGLARHADTHDVLAVQVHGAKHWDVDRLGPTDLTAGDLLYLPAGTEHNASTGEQPSLHLTVGIHRPTPDRIARRAASLATRKRIGSGSAPGSAEETADRSLRSLRDALDGIDAEEVIDDLRRPPRIHEGGLLAASVRRPTIDADSTLVAAGDWTVSPVGDDRVRLTWSTGRLFLPARTSAALEQLAASCRPVRVGDLAGLETGGRLVLARRLLDEGAAALAHGR